MGLGLGLFDRFRGISRNAQTTIAKASAAEQKGAAAEANVLGKVERETVELLRMESEEMKLVRELIGLANQRGNIEQRLAYAEGRARRSLGRFKGAAAMMQRIAQRGARIASTGVQGAAVGGVTVGEARVLAQENQALAQEAVNVMREAEAYQQGMRQHIALSRNLTNALQKAEVLARMYAEELKEVPILEEQDKKLLNDLNNVSRFVRIQRQRARAQMQQLSAARQV